MSKSIISLLPVYTGHRVFLFSVKFKTKLRRQIKESDKLEKLEQYNIGN